MSVAEPAQRRGASSTQSGSEAASPTQPSVRPDRAEPSSAAPVALSSQASSADSIDSAPQRPAIAAPQRPASGTQRDGGGERNGGCTAAQLRRFVKSRAYVPLHELRRRFDLPGTEDEVSPVAVDGRHLFVGLPPREASLLGELLGAGDVGYELLLDPASPLIVGLFPMRPVPRG